MLLSLLFACATPEPTDTASSTPDTGDSGADTADTASAPTICDQLGLPVRAWDPSGTEGEFDLVAPDATLTQMDGSSWTLSTAWTGCESVMFVVLRNDYAYPDFSKRADIRDWMEGAPANTHWVFFSSEASESDRQASLARLQSEIENVADDDPTLLAQWQGHTHFVSTDWSETGTWMDDLVATYGSGDLPLNWGVDRLQHIREVGYLGDPITGWKTYPATFLDYEAIWYEHQAQLQDRLDVDAATVTRVFESSSERIATMDFGSAATVAGYDTMELDLSFICNGHPDASGCGEWDYLAYVYLCDVDDPSTTDVDESGTCTEIGRFITAYARPGRWVVDATPFLALVQDGGERVIRVDSANAPFITLDVRLSNQGKGVRPVGIEYLWAGGSFNQDYNTGREPITFTPPAGTTRVDVMGLISGHGYGQDRANCAEFCNHQHEFTVNGGGAYLDEFPMAGTDYGCAEQVESGTVPNQYGTWVLGRGGWCPGRQVDPWSADVTADVNLTGENSIVYRGLYEGEAYVPQPYDSGQGFGARVDVNSWLVYYQ